MSYAELYKHCQKQGPKVSRRVVYAKVLGLTGVDRIRHIKTTLDVRVTRGMYLSAQNTTSKFVQQVGSRVILTARDLNYCWERFVFTKELMHSFDNPEQATDSGEVFDTLLQELTGPRAAAQLSPQAGSEYDAFWMALGVLCPEQLRIDYAQKLADKQLDEYAIALQLRIPELYVPLLFEPRYRPIIDSLTA